MKSQITLVIAALLVFFSCNPDQEKSTPSFAPKVVEAHGYVVPKDSMREPKVIPAGKPRVVLAGKPEVVLTNTNVHPAGIPNVVMAGVPKVCTPGQDSFSLPKTVTAIDSPFLAGIPEVVTAKEPYTKDQNPQNFSSFGKLQGLKNAEIACLIEDRSGNLWFGTLGGGVSKYDGKSFTHYSEKEGLSHSNIWSILEDKSGNLWFGTFNGGVSKFDGKSFTHYTTREGLSNNFVWSILEDKSGNLWFGTIGGGVSKYDGKSFTHFTVKEGLSNNGVRSILEDKSGNLWFGTDRGVSKYDGKTFTHFTMKEGLIGNVVISIAEDKSGNLWFGTAGGVSKYDGKSFTNFTVKEGLSNNVVWSIVEDKSGNLWFGTPGGVSKYDGKSFTHFTVKEGLSNNYVSSILEDKRGNLWFGTHGGGVSKYEGRRFTYFTENEGLSNNAVFSILEDKSGNLWFGTAGGGVSKYKGSAGFGNENLSVSAKVGASVPAGDKAGGKSFTHFTIKEGMGSNYVYSIVEDKSGNFWFGTSGGVSKYDGKSFTHFTIKEGMSDNHVWNILEDRRGNLWFGTLGGGVSKYDGKSFTNFTVKEGLGNNNIYRSLEDRSGNLWFITIGGGMSKYDGKNITHFTVKEGLSSNAFTSILEDKRGNLWFGTLGGGVIKYDGKTFTHFTEKEGLSNNDVWSILEDKSGNIWFGTSFGLSKLERDNAANTNPIAPDSLTESSVFFKTYTYEDGFSGIGVNGGLTICEAKDGTIWIGANDRLTAFHPDGDSRDTIAPNIQLTGLALFNENFAWQNFANKKDTDIVLGNGVRVHDFHFDEVSKWYGIPEQLSLPYNNNYLTFQFAGITIQSPKKVRYQYKLEGLDKNWSTLTSRSEAPYGNLPHGTYTFKVKAMNGEGYWSKELNYSFTIRPPLWLTWWAYAIYGLLLGVSGWLVHRYQKQRTIRIERQKAQKKELKLAKVIEKAYTELKATQTQLIQSEKMASLGELTAGIAHEIQNPLNFINNFSDVNGELIEELKNELKADNKDEAFAIADDIKQNEQKINHHGKRADAIVKGMLQHSRASTGKKEPTDINALADEYLRLSYHGFRAKDKDFNATIKTDFDESLSADEAGIAKIEVVPQDIGRVLLNLYNNAFYAVNEKKKQLNGTFEPTVSVTTKRSLSFGEGRGEILISVKDNGTGIPQKVLDKIYQPFFTTKPTGQGTGLGLSLSYDIIKAHGGEIKVVSKEGEGAEFIIELPV